MFIGVSGQSSSKPACLHALCQAGHLDTNLSNMRKECFPPAEDKYTRVFGERFTKLQHWQAIHPGSMITMRVQQSSKVFMLKIEGLEGT
eukprot:1150342-Pelagomonas_calceolata.AAC.7